MSWALCRPSGTRLINLILPGTDVPGYRLLRPYGTVSVTFTSDYRGVPSLFPRKRPNARSFSCRQWPRSLDPCF
jgi:hypothetical protein